MPNKCRAPNCKYNYESEIALRKTQPKWQRCTLFEDPARRRLWISRVPRIWKLTDTQRLFLCEMHFKSEDIIKESTDTNGRRKRKKKTDVLYTKPYRETAVPCIWPNAPAHLTNVAPARVTSCVTSESREENAQMYQEELESARIERDTWRSLDELSEKIDQLNLPGGVMKYKTDDYMKKIHLMILL